MGFLKKTLSLVTAASLVMTMGAASAFADEIEAATDDGNGNHFGSAHIVYVDENNEEIELDLTPDDVITPSGATASQSYFNLMEEGLATSVKNQNPYNTCWAFAGASAAESSMLMAGAANSSVDYSEMHIAWFANGRGPTDTTDPLYGDCAFEFGAATYDNGGLIYDVIGVLSRWSGAQLETNAPYTLLTGGTQTHLPESQRYASYAHLQNADFIDYTDRQSIKNALVSTGAVYTAYFHSDAFYKPSTAAFHSTIQSNNHAVTIVGWDDNYAISNFSSGSQPTTKGAWIVKNNWGTDWGKNGLFYISYETPMYQISTLEMEPVTNYSAIYQHDGAIGKTALDDNSVSMNAYYYSSGTTAANVYTSKGTDPLAAVSFYTFEASIPYTITVYKNVSSTPSTGTVAHTQSGTMTYAGYHTIDLTKAVSLAKGEKFAVAVTLNKDAFMSYDTHAPSAGLSYYTTGALSGSPTWYDSYSEVGQSACIKAFTKAAAPAKPAFKVTAGNAAASIVWSAVPNATKYAVYTYTKTDGYKLLGTTTKTAYAATGLKNGTQYGFLVRAYGNGQWSEYTKSDLIYATPVAPAVLTKPAVTTVTPGNGTMAIVWDAQAAATKYAVYTYTRAEGYKLIGTTSKNAYVVSGLTNGTTYGFLVRAYGNGAWTSYTKADNIYAAPGAVKPVFVSVTAGNKQTALVWANLQGATKYAVYSYLNGKYTLVGTTTKRAYVVSGLTNGTEYGFLIRAYVNGAWTPYNTATDLRYATPTA